MSQAAARPGPLLDGRQIRQLLAAGASWRGWESLRQGGSNGRIGDHAARALGSGLDYAETRQYLPGDDPRHINWRASARSRETQLRVFHRDINPQACLLIDRRRAMCFGTRTRLKLAQALRLALLLAAHEGDHGHEVACLELERQLHWLPPRLGPAALQQLSARFNRACPCADDHSGEPSLGEALDLLQGRLPRGSRLYLLSDFADLGESDARVLQRLAREYAVFAVRIHDPAERCLPALGPVTLSWGGAHSRLDADAGLQARQQAVFDQRHAWLAQLFSSAGAMYRDIASDIEDLVMALDEAGAGQGNG